MKILQIKINNLASLEGETTIDFTSEPLASAGIFAITGPTGAGKSTILDALCLALYARTPRYVQAGASRGIELQDSSGDTIHQGDPRAILRDGTAEGSASVIFMGIDGDHYEATWSVRRARLKITGKLGAYNHSLFNITRQKDIPGTKTVIQKEIERLVGLNFDQFTRSVLLAQGDFTAFMKANKEEKSALLEKLTGSQIYSEISKNIYEHYKVEEEALKALRAKAENIDILTEEQRTLIEEEIVLYQNQIHDQSEEKTLTDKAVSWHRQKADLEAKKQEALQLYDTATSAAAALSDTKTQLDQALEVRPLKAVQEGLLEEQALLKEISQTREELDKKLQTLTDQKTKATTTYQTLAVQKNEHEKALKEAKPSLLQASLLDSRIYAAKEQMTSFQRVLAASLQAKEELAKQQKAVQAKLETHETSLQSAVEWIRQRQDRSKIAEHTELITGRLEEAKELGRRCSEHKEAITSGTREIERQGQQLIALNNQLTETEKEYEENIRLLREVQQQLMQANGDALEEELSMVQNKERALDRAQGQFELFDRSLKDHEEAQQKVSGNRQLIQTLTAQAAEIQPKVAALEIQVKTTRDLIAKASLRHAENIQQLRASLHPGDPCPVCGSTAHPYSTDAHTDLGDQLVDALKDELDAAEKAFAATHLQYTQIEAENSLRQKQQQLLEETAENKQAAYQNAEKQWSATTFSSQLKEKSAAEINQWLSRSLATHREALESLQARKASVRKLLQEQERLQQTTDKQRVGLQKLKDTQKDLQSGIHLKTQLLSAGKTALQEALDQLQAIQSSLNPYFSSTDWFSNWEAAPDTFMDAIQKFAADWKTKQQASENLSRQVDQFKIESQGFDRQLEALTKQLRQQEQTVTQQEHLLEGLLEERKKLFDGQSVAEAEKQLQDAVETAAQQAETARSQAENLEKEWTKCHFEKGVLENNYQQAAAKHQQLDQKITDWISHYNIKKKNAPLKRAQVETLLGFSDQWIQQCQEKIKQSDSEVQDVKARLEERERDLKKHLSTAGDLKTLEELLALQAAQASSLEQLQKDLLERQFRLENNQKNIQKLGGFQKEIDGQQKIFDEWAALNSLIGSKEGRKFREIAQQYTLDLLLQYANQHLYVLSKRYMLSRIQDSLGIQVIDQDMADEIRSVYSLSGGESFLVSRVFL
ncbi:AAA family ATPase [Arachidicoccus terrestris]|uniref:AAA family ATPase n=1 Tax=Arachidicoccus terrestris TaxID=2875539 RepID=UPI001CC62C5B|nr:AAA family ATPase [Arachidicoccus terrestris]UAY56067.1 hypothetical protein K9M52_03290 [Arachidicoccus terrestris]